MKRMFFIVAAGLLCFSMAGCGAKEKAESEVTAKVEEKTEDVKEEVEEAEEEALAEAMTDGEEAEEELVGDIAEETAYAEDFSGGKEDVFVYGDFTATLRALTPDYVLDGDTPQVAILTLFQDTPFALYIGYEKAYELEVGNTYTFELQMTEIEADPEELEYPDPTYFLRKYNIGIGNIRPAEEDELGLNAVRISYRPAD